MKKSIIAALAGTIVVTSVGFGGIASAMDKAITFSVDGEVQQIHVWGSTVQDALNHQGIVLDNYDEVTPAASEPIRDGSVVEVAYGREVTIIVDGVEQRFWTTALNLDAALAEFGLHNADTQLSVDRTLPLGRDGLTLSATTPKQVTIQTAGGAQQITSTAADVAGLLAENGIEVDADDRVTPSLSDRLTADLVIQVQSVEVTEVAETQVLPHATISSEDDTVLKNTKKVAVEGVDGEQVVVFEVVTVDGVEESRTPISQTVTVEPVTEEIKIGTKATVTPSANGSYSGSHADWMTAAGIDPADFSAAEILITRESTWNPNAVNPSSGACGLVQALPCSKLGPNWNDPIVALQWGDNYVKQRYGGWQAALAHSYAYGWY